MAEKKSRLRFFHDAACEQKPFALTPTQLLVKRRKEEEESPVVACCLSFTNYSFLTVHLYSVNLLQYTSTDKIIVFFLLSWTVKQNPREFVIFGRSG